MEQQVKKVLKGVSRLISFVKLGWIVVTVLALSGGCATLDSVSGKAALEKEKADIEQQLAACKAQRSELENSKVDLEKQLSNEKESLKEVEADYQKQIKTLEKSKTVLEEEKADIEQQLAACKAERTELEKQLSNEKESLKKVEANYQKQIKKLEKSKVKGMSVIFFAGDITYEISFAAFKDYRAGLRYRALHDVDFAPEYEKFEKGKGGDALVLGVLKEIDTSGDRIIDTREALRFRKSEEDTYAKEKAY